MLKKELLAELEELKYGIQHLIDWPSEDYERRSDDGYPTEFVYDEFAYRRIIDGYRKYLQSLLTAEDDNG